jgi:hypothetical protein
MQTISSIGSSLDAIIGSTWFETLRFVLEVSAVVLGVKAYLDIKKQLDAADGLAAKLASVSGTLTLDSGKLTSVSEKLTSVSKTLSTRFIGYFPANFRKIAQVLNNATRSVRIMVDYADYGSLTDHDNYLKYIGRLYELGNDHGIEVKMIVYPLNEARSRIEADFGTNEKLKNYKNEDAIKSLLKRRCVETLPDAKVVVDWLIEYQLKKEEQLKQEGVALATYEHLPLFCWIADDDQEAVFTFPLQEDPGSYPGKVEPFRTSEISFYTRETKIVQTLSRTFDEIYAKATKGPSPTGITSGE